MKKNHFVLIIVLAVGVGLSSLTLRAQDAKQSSPGAGTKQDKQVPAPHDEIKNGQQYSGTYSFLKDGEFVQLTVEDDSRVSGFISRFGDGDSDKGAFLDQFFKSGKLDGNKLTFTTQTVHGVAFEFKGTVERGEGKNPGDEAYLMLKGTLTQSTTDANKKVTTHSQDVAFRIFPRDAIPAPTVRN